MSDVYFSHKNVPHNFLYSFKSEDGGPVPAVGDIIEFDWEDYEHIDNMGFEFKVVKKTIIYMESANEIHIDVESCETKSEAESDKLKISTERNELLNKEVADVRLREQALLTEIERMRMVYNEEIDTMNIYNDEIRGRLKRKSEALKASRAKSIKLQVVIDKLSNKGAGNA